MKLMQVDLLDVLPRLFAWRDYLLGRLFLAFAMLLAFSALAALMIHFAFALSHFVVNPIPAPRLLD